MSPKRPTAVRFLRGPILDLVLLVRLEPDRDADVRIDAAVDDGERALGLESVDAVVCRRMRVLLRLLQPLLARRRLRRRMLPRHVGVVLPANGQGEQRDRQHRRR
jgi:hypothetical protein